MLDRARLEAFLALDPLALLGASRSGRKFGNAILKALRDRGTRVVPVHPSAEALEGLACVPSVGDLPPGVTGAVLVIPPAAVLEALPGLAAAGVRRIWVQQGGESASAAALAEALGLDLIQGHCLLMFLPGMGWFHRAHHRVAAWIGQVPA